MRETERHAQPDIAVMLCGSRIVLKSPELPDSFLDLDQRARRAGDGNYPLELLVDELR